jgi:adenosylmethionine-8-amino-7-oxononanoate aminotransferase
MRVSIPDARTTGVLPKTFCSERFHVIGEARGIGAMVAMELVTDRSTREPAARLTSEILRYCHAHGLALLKAGPYDNVIRLLFPLVIGEQELDRGLDILEEALGSVTRNLPLGQPFDGLSALDQFKEGERECSNDRRYLLRFRWVRRW